MSTTARYVALQKLEGRYSGASTNGHSRSSSGVTTQSERSFQSASLGRWSSSRRALFAFEVAFALIPLLFIVLAIIAGSLHGKPISRLGESIVRLIPLLPSAFPIVFAALLGKCFHALALYRAEKGVSLATLERLIGCNSLFAAVERQIAICRVDIIGLGIVLTWALSPLGGQAGLRLLSKSPQVSTSVTDIRYVPREAFVSTWMIGADGVMAGWSAYAPTFMTALRTSTLNQGFSSTDFWNNVKIPDLDWAINSSGKDASSWISVGDNNYGNITYTSLLGLPIEGVPATGNSTFEVTSRYWSVKCQNITYDSKSSFRFSVSSFVIINSIWNYSSAGPESDPLPFQFVSLVTEDEDAWEVMQASCTLGTRDVDSTIQCLNNATPPNCSVVAVRAATSIPGFGALGPRNLDIGVALQAFPNTTSGNTGGTLRSSTLTEHWLADPSKVYSSSADFDFVNLSTLPEEVLSQRLQIAFNTFWQSTYGSKQLAGNFTSNDPDKFDCDYPCADALAIAYNKSVALVTQYDGELYVTHWTYVVLLLLISNILLIASIATLILKCITIAPDILGYVSTVTRDNPHINAVYGGSYLDGLDRTKEIRDIRVRIGDVTPRASVGHISLRAMGDGMDALKRGRLYD